MIKIYDIFFIANTKCADTANDILNLEAAGCKRYYQFLSDNQTGQRHIIEKTFSLFWLP